MSSGAKQKTSLDVTLEIATLMSKSGDKYFKKKKFKKALDNYEKALEIERKDLNKANEWVQGQKPPAGFQALFDDRLGDIAVLQKKNEDAKRHFLAAWKGMEEQNEYRRLIEVKLAALGVNPNEADKP
jgi:predicted negative regulator of RcsB-dependent stress response